MLHPEGQGVDIGLNDRAAECDPMHVVRQYPDVLSPNARSVLKSLIPGLIYKSLQYAFSAHQARENLRAVGSEGLPPELVAWHCEVSDVSTATFPNGPELGHHGEAWFFAVSCACL